MNIEEKEIDFRYPWNSLEGIKGKVYIFPANPNKGYNFGYSIFIPQGC